MVSAGWLPILAIIIPACVIIGWLACATGSRLDARHYRPLPVRHEQLPWREQRYQDQRDVVDSYRPARWHYQPELAPTTTINHYYLGTGVADWRPQRPPVVQRAESARELLP